MFATFPPAKIHNSLKNHSKQIAFNFILTFYEDLLKYTSTRRNGIQ